jgi:hypothetical protein
MLLHSRLRLLIRLPSFQMLMMFLKNGSKFNYFGKISLLSSQPVISLRTCQTRLKFSEESTRAGDRIWNVHSKLRMLFNAARMNYLRVHLESCNLVLKNAKRDLNFIWSKSVVNSPVSTSVQMTICSKFYLKVQIHMPSKMTSRSFSMLLTLSLLMSKIANLS